MTQHPTPDPDLARRARSLLGTDAWAVATVTPDGTRVAVQDVEPGDDLEIGSISKGLTGLLLVDAIGRGEVSPGDRLGRHLDLDGSPAAEVTLGSLAVHRSGLPSLPAQAHMVRRSVSWMVRGTNPYGDTLAEVLEQTRATKVGKPRATYSNLGFQLLGHAVASAAGGAYRDVLRERVLGPLGLSTAYVPATEAELSPRAVVGVSRLGRRADPWTGEALGPAGGVRMSVEDAARLASALVRGEAPGVGALDPVEDFVGPMRIGAAWITTPGSSGDVVWHNGGTGGFRTWLGMDRARGTAAVVLRARSASADQAGLALLADL